MERDRSEVGRRGLKGGQFGGGGGGVLLVAGFERGIFFDAIMLPFKMIKTV